MTTSAWQGIEFPLIRPHKLHEAQCMRHPEVNLEEKDATQYHD